AREGGGAGCGPGGSPWPARGDGRLAGRPRAASRPETSSRGETGGERGASREPDDRRAAAGKAGAATLGTPETRLFAAYEHLVSVPGSSAAAASPLAARHSQCSRRRTLAPRPTRDEVSGRNQFEDAAGCPRPAGARGPTRLDAGLLEHPVVLRRDDAADGHHDVAGAEALELADELRDERLVAARLGRDTDDVDVVLDCLARHLLGRLEER